MNQNLSEFVGEIYETIQDPGKWRHVVAQLCQLMNATSAGIYVHNKKTNSYKILASFGLNPAVRDSYDVGLGQHDYAYQEVQKKPVGVAAHVLSYDDVKDQQPKYVQLLLKPNDTHHVAGLGVIHNDEHFVAIKLHRREGSARFEDDKLSLLTELHPHFERAIRQYWVHQELAHDNYRLKSTLSKISLGVLIINGDMQVEFINPVASRILARHGALEYQPLIKAYYESEQQKLKKTVEEILAPRYLAEEVKPRAVGLHHPDRSVPLILILTPGCNALTEGRFDSASGDCVSIYLSDPESPINIKEEALCNVHGLTMTEASIAISVANGLTLKEISEINQTSLGTVRTQIKQIFNKTGVTRQQDLIRLLVSGAYNLNEADQ